MEVTVQELAQWEPGSYMTVDMRSEETRAYGMLPGAVPVLPDALFSFAAQNRGKKLVLYCAHGEASLDAAQALCEQGFAAYRRWCSLTKTIWSDWFVVLRMHDTPKGLLPCLW